MKNKYVVLTFAAQISLYAQGAPLVPAQGQETLRQESNANSTQQMLAPSVPPVFMQSGPSEAETAIISLDTECQQIISLQIEGDEQGLLSRDIHDMVRQGQQACLGPAGIKQLERNIRNRLVADGFVTSTAALIDRGNGRLVLTINYGRIGKISLGAGSSGYFHPTAVFPLQAGDVLNVRNVEQGLENMSLIPDLETDIQISPGEKHGESDIEILRKQDKYWSMTTWLDNSGSTATGRYQAGAALYLYNATSLNDVMYGAVTRNPGHSDSRSSRTHALYYMVPYGFWNLTLANATSQYNQTIIGRFSNYRYHGESSSYSAQVGHVISRGMRHKTSLSVQFMQRDYRYYLNNTEIELQRSRLSSLQLKLEHVHYLNAARFNASLSLVKPRPWLNASEQTEGSGSGNYLVKSNASIALPVSAAGRSMSYLGELTLQGASYRLPIQDKLFIGDRNSVRGFDGEFGLAGSNAGYWRNTLQLNLADVQPYIGLDYGHVFNEDEGLSGSLAGAVIGVRADKWNTRADLFIGAPLMTPRAFPNKSGSLGFSLQWTFN